MFTHIIDQDCRIFVCQRDVYLKQVQQIIREQLRYESFEKAIEWDLDDHFVSQWSNALVRWHLRLRQTGVLQSLRIAPTPSNGRVSHFHVLVWHVVCAGDNHHH